MNEFIEKNRKLLLFYYWAARVGGWVVLSLASLAVAGHSFALASRIGDWNEFYRYYQHDVPWVIFNNGLPTGLLVLGVAQLIWYLLETNRQPRWIFRNADKLLYTYTAILIGYYCWIGVTEVILHFNEPYDFPLRLIALVVFILVKLLVLVGVAEVLRRLLPMIEESRTLV
ncbi:MAG TPA: hypothetical protein VMX36_12135 [Sedimentisphaerales bacterium]|nr:hypothetical protein [Sedimentisphaerales bacterium]